MLPHAKGASPDFKMGDRVQVLSQHTALVCCLTMTVQQGSSLQAEILLALHSTDAEKCWVRSTVSVQVQLKGHAANPNYEGKLYTVEAFEGFHSQSQRIDNLL